MLDLHILLTPSELTPLTTLLVAARRTYCKANVLVSLISRTHIPRQETRLVFVIVLLMSYSDYAVDRQLLIKEFPSASICYSR